jgi:hypothetical protein
VDGNRIHISKVKSPANVSEESVGILIFPEPENCIDAEPNLAVPAVDTVPVVVIEDVRFSDELSLRFPSPCSNSATFAKFESVGTVPGVTLLVADV